MQVGKDSSALDDRLTIVIDWMRNIWNRVVRAVAVYNNSWQWVAAEQTAGSIRLPKMIIWHHCLWYLIVTRWAIHSGSGACCLVEESECMDKRGRSQEISWSQKADQGAFDAAKGLFFYLKTLFWPNIVTHIHIQRISLMLLIYLRPIHNPTSPIPSSTHPIYDNHCNTHTVVEWKIGYYIWVFSVLHPNI